MRLARRMSAQALPAARDERVRDVHLHTSTSEKPTKQAVRDALRDYNALFAPQIAF
jgi:hypothetical protein